MDIKSINQSIISPQRLEEKKVLNSMTPGASSAAASVPPSGRQSSAATPTMKTRAGTVIPDILLEEPTIIDDAVKEEHQETLKQFLPQT